jgi:hypothetical protein
MIKIAHIGTDPEFVVLDAEGNLASSIDFLPGTKETPFDLGNGTYVQVDNVMAEFCVPPTNSPKELWDALQYAKQAALQFLPAGYSFATIASAVYPDKLLDNPIAQVFGREPDFTPYYPKGTLKNNVSNRITDLFSGSMRVNPKPNCADKNLRSCGGHIHLDYFDSICIIKDPTTLQRLTSIIILLCDLYLGIPSVLEDPDTNRRLLYGKPGSHRPKSYGLEYRVLSNYWLESLDMITAIFERIKLIEKALNSRITSISGGTIYGYNELNSHINSILNKFNINTIEDLDDIIINNNTKVAGEICSFLEIKPLIKEKV